MTVSTHFEDEETEPRQRKTSHLRDSHTMETVLLTPPLPTGEKSCFQYLGTVPRTNFCGKPLCDQNFLWSTLMPGRELLKGPKSSHSHASLGPGRVTHCGSHKAIQTYHSALQASHHILFPLRSLDLLLHWKPHHPQLLHEFNCPTPLRLWQIPHRAWKTLCIKKCISNRICHSPSALTLSF